MSKDLVSDQLSLASGIDQLASMTGGAIRDQVTSTDSGTLFLQVPEVVRRLHQAETNWEKAPFLGFLRFVADQKRALPDDIYQTLLSVDDYQTLSLVAGREDVPSHILIQATLLHIQREVQQQEVGSCRGFISGRIPLWVMRFATETFFRLRTVGREASFLVALRRNNQIPLIFQAKFVQSPKMTGLVEHYFWYNTDDTLDRSRVQDIAEQSPELVGLPADLTRELVLAMDEVNDPEWNQPVPTEFQHLVDAVETALMEVGA